MKILKVAMLLLIFTLVGCGKKNYIICNLDIDNDIQNYSVIGSYTVYYNNGFVTAIKEQEIYTSEDESIIKYFYESKKLEYYDLNDKYGTFTYEVKRTNNSVSLNSKIDMKEFDLDYMAKERKIDKDYVVNGKLTLNGIKKIYQERGAICIE